MDNELRTLLQEYLVGQKSLDDLRDWVALNIWDTPADQYNEIDDLAIELGHLDDQLVEEPEKYFRVQVWALLGEFGMGTAGNSVAFIQTRLVTSGATYVESIPHNPTAPLKVDWQPA